MTSTNHPPQEDLVLKNSRREALCILAVWVAATAYCCVYSYSFGYIRDGHELGKRDVHPTLGMPSWFFFGVILPWGICGLFTLWFVGFQMTDDDLGEDLGDARDRP